MAAAEEERVELERKLLDRATPLPARFRALFSLRGLGGDAVRAAFAKGASLSSATSPPAATSLLLRLSSRRPCAGLEDPSALLRHEIAFCLGQMQDAESVGILIALLENASEHPMVRHEAAEALGAIATPRCLEPLRAHVDDESQEVRETCRLALRRVQDQRTRSYPTTLPPSPSHSSLGCSATVWCPSPRSGWRTRRTGTSPSAQPRRVSPRETPPNCAWHCVARCRRP
jgi:deoxyhypusine monooxygenase